MNVVYKCYAVDTITGLKLQKKVAGKWKYKDSTYYGYHYLYHSLKLFKQTS